MPKSIIDRTGETGIANNGMKMTIVAYRKSNDIDVKFEDGTMIEHRQYSNFKKGYISNKDEKFLDHRVGESKIANNGLKMTIITYRNARY